MDFATDPKAIVSRSVRRMSVTFPIRQFEVVSAVDDQTGLNVCHERVDVLGDKVASCIDRARFWSEDFETNAIKSAMVLWTASPPSVAPKIPRHKTLERPKLSRWSGHWGATQSGTARTMQGM